MTRTENFLTKNNYQISTKELTENLKNLKIKKSSDYNICKYADQFLCCCIISKTNLKSKEIYIKSRKVLKEMLNINTIIQKQMEFNRVKYIKLSEKELCLFNALPQPNISSKYNNELKDPYFEDVLNNDVNIEKVVKYFSESSEEEFKTEKLI